MQPTGGPLLLDDTQPDEPKSLMEEKLKKVTTERAPVAGQQPSRQSRAGLRPGGGRNLREELMMDPERASAFTDQLIRSHLGPGGGLPQTPGGDGGMGSGAAAAAGVLTAVDEDGEGDEEAKLPDDFEYFSDGNDDDEEL